jgi:sec-independent protein translocase protein TatA
MPYCPTAYTKGTWPPGHDSTMFNLYANVFGMESWLIIAVLVLLLFGGKKIPELMRGLGRGVGELQKGLEDGKRALHNSVQEEASRPDTVTTTEAPAASGNPPVTK